MRQRKETAEGDQLLVVLGETISSARCELGLTQTELARRVRVSRFQMCKHESGQAEMPVTRLFEICKALQLKPADVMRNVGKSLNGGRRA